MADSLASLKGSFAVITGACGFLGRAMAVRLEQVGAQVLGIDLASEIKGEPRTANYCQGNILDPESLRAPLESICARSNGEAMIFHFAGLAHVGMCQEDPVRAFELNATGTVNVLEAARLAGLRRILVPSTVLVYGTPQRLPIEESDLPFPASIYGASKLAAEAALQGYAASFGFACTIARLGNVYGQTKPVDSIISILASQALAGGPLSVRTLKPVRDFIHQHDVTEALMRLSQITQVPGCRVVNVSSGTSNSIRDVADAVCHASSLPLAVQESDPDSGNADPGLSLNIQRLTELTGWQPELSLDQGVARTLNEMAAAS